MTRPAILLAASLAVFATTARSQDWTDHFHVLKDGTKLHYVEQGEGTLVILIHGAGGSAVGNWFRNGIGPALARTNRVIAIDMRGHGQTESAEGGGLANMPQDVLELMDHLEIDKAHIGGYSMGGFVTASILRTNPERFITASFGGSGITETQEWRDKVPPDVEGEAPDEARAREAYYAARAARGETTTRRGAVGAVARSGRGRAARPPIDLSKIDFPVLAINGEYDRPNAKTHRMWRELKNFTNVVLPGKGHLSAVMAQTIPQQYIDSMVDFITSNNPKPDVQPGRRAAQMAYANAARKVRDGLFQDAVADLGRAMENGFAPATDVLRDTSLRPMREDPDARLALSELLKQYARDNRVTMVDREEPGRRIRLRGRVMDAESGEPLADALVQFYQTDASGEYRPGMDAGGGAGNPRLFGYLRTDRDGQFTVDTIMPERYPDSTVPRHVHYRVWAEGYPEFNSECFFDSDPLLTDATRASAPRRGFPIVVLEDREGELTIRVTR